MATSSSTRQYITSNDFFCWCWHSGQHQQKKSVWSPPTWTNFVQVGVLHSPCRPTFFSWDQYPKLEMDFQLQFGCWSSYQDAGWVCNWHSFIKMVGCSLPGSRWSQKKLILMAACILPNYLLTSNLSQNQRWVEKAEERGDAPPPFYKHTYKLSYFFTYPEDQVSWQGTNVEGVFTCGYTDIKWL